MRNHFPQRATANLREPSQRCHLVLLLLLLLLPACTQTTPPGVERPPLQVQVIADGESQHVTTEATTVRELLAEVGLILNETDEVVPPLFTPLSEGLTITVVRITESVEVVTHGIPFARKVVRNDTMEADDPPRIVQAGKPGLEERTVRIVYRDGLEAERWETSVAVIEPAQDEIVMVGIGAIRGNLSFAGALAYISSGTAVLLRGSTLFPEQLAVGGALDGRVFSLSPTGGYLLYTRAGANTTTFSNSLWVLSTERGAAPRPLGVNNVLWADWNPARADLLQIAYTTAISTSLPPGWEANNDLWLGDILQSEEAPFTPEQVVESYPAPYGWWGGNYAWSPDGRYVAFSYANEVGLIDLAATEEETRHRSLHNFTEYNTLSDWVWTPTLSWSPDGRFLTFTHHAGDDPNALAFDSWALDVRTGVAGRFVEQTGMWGHLHWATPGAPDDSQIAYLRATNPLDSLRSSYTLWLMDQDGSNGRQIYPPGGENSNFPREARFMAWGPTGRDIAFVFNNALHLFNLDSLEAYRVTQDDATITHPSWAPYGQGITGDLSTTRPQAAPSPPRHTIQDFLPDE
jgi:resuscitation-promoting factor RpfB